MRKSTAFVEKYSHKIFTNNRDGCEHHAQYNRRGEHAKL